MRKTIIRMVMALLCLMSITFTTGCNFNSSEEKDIQIGKMEEQIKTLRLNNARLKKEVVISEVNQTGSGFTFVAITGAFIITNNLIWWIVYRRRNDKIII